MLSEASLKVFIFVQVLGCYFLSESDAQRYTMVSSLPSSPPLSVSRETRALRSS